MKIDAHISKYSVDNEKEIITLTVTTARSGTTAAELVRLGNSTLVIEAEFKQGELKGCGKQEPTLFDQPPPDLDKIKAEVCALWAKFRAEKDAKAQELINDQIIPHENVLLACGVYVEFDDETGEFIETPIFRDATDGELIEADETFRMEPAKNHALLKRLGATLQARGYSPVVEGYGDDVSVSWVKQAVSDDDQTLIARHAELMASAQADDGEINGGVEQELQEVVRVLYERGYTVQNDGGKFVWSKSN